MAVVVICSTQVAGFRPSLSLGTPGIACRHSSYLKSRNYASPVGFPIWNRAHSRTPQNGQKISH